LSTKHADAAADQSDDHATLLVAVVRLVPAFPVNNVSCSTRYISLSTWAFQ